MSTPEDQMPREAQMPATWRESMPVLIMLAAVLSLVAYLLGVAHDKMQAEQAAQIRVLTYAELDQIPPGSCTHEKAALHAGSGHVVTVGTLETFRTVCGEFDYEKAGEDRAIAAVQAEVLAASKEHNDIYEYGATR